MRYVIVENDEIVHLGPINWNTRLFNAVLRDDLELPLELLPSHEQSVPFAVTPSVKILPVREVLPDMNPKIQQLAGPIWEFTEDLAIATYTTVDRPVHTVRDELRTEAAAERFRREIEGTKIVLQGQTVTVATTREARAAYLEQYTLLDQHEAVNWKFPEGWLTLSKSELRDVINAAKQKVQEAFTWEMNLADSLREKTLQELSSVKIREEPKRGPANRL